jgi:plasmid stabilization system protein ParE
MAYKIVWTKRAERTMNAVVDYLEFTWSEKVANDFIDNFNTHLSLLKAGVLTGRASSIINVRSLLITKHNRLYFRKKGDAIQLLLVFDTRLNPVKNPFE